MANYNISKLNYMGMPVPLRYRKKPSNSKFPSLSKQEIEQLLGFAQLDEESRSIIKFILDEKRVECKPAGVDRLEEILRENKLKDEDVKILQGFKSMFIGEYNAYINEQTWKDAIDRPRTKTSGLASPYMEDYITTPPTVQNPYSGINFKPSTYDLDENGRDMDGYKPPKKKHSQIERLEEMIRNGEVKMPKSKKQKKPHFYGSIGILDFFETIGGWVGKLLKSKDGGYYTDMKEFANLNKKKLDLSIKDAQDIKDSLKPSETNEEEYKGKSAWQRFKL